MIIKTNLVSRLKHKRIEPIQIIYISDRGLYNIFMDNSTLNSIVNYIKNNPLCVMSTVDPNNKANGASMYIVSDENLNVFFMTKTNTRKYQNIMNNPSVSFTLHNESGLTTLQMIGDAVPIDPAVDDNQKIYDLFEGVRDKILNYSLPISKLSAGDYVMFKVNVDHALLTEYKQEDITEGLSRKEYMR